MDVVRQARTQSRGFDKAARVCYNLGMLRGRLLKLVGSLAFGLMLLDVVSDTTGCHDLTPATTACHACSCSAHVAAPAVRQVAEVLVEMPNAVYVEPSYHIVLVESFFRPPRLAA